MSLVDRLEFLSLRDESTTRLFTVVPSDSDQVCVRICDNYRMLVNQEVMSGLGLAADEPVWIDDDKIYIVRVWLSSSTIESNVGLSTTILTNAGIEIGQTISIVPLKDRIKNVSIATKISISIDPKGRIDAFRQNQIRHFLERVEYTSSECSYSFYPDANFKLMKIFVRSINDESGKRAYRINSDTNIIVLSDHQKDVYATPIGGLDAEMNLLMKTIMDPINHEQLFIQNKIRMPRGVLIYGPPGTGKTMLVRSVSRLSGLYTMFVDGTEIMSKYQGDSEARLRQIFDEARLNQPSIIFFDEIDALCPKREEGGSSAESRVVATFLALLDGKKDGSENPEKVFVLAATNSPNSIDSALRRPGRFDKEIELGPPTPLARRQILTTILKNVYNSIREDTVKMLAEKAHGFVGADLALICREAAVLAITRSPMDPILIDEDLISALDRVKPSATREVHPSYSDLIMA